MLNFLSSNPSVWPILSPALSVLSCVVLFAGVTTAVAASGYPSHHIVMTAANTANTCYCGPETSSSTIKPNVVQPK